MADAYHAYLSEELPLSLPTNKRRERAIEVSSFAATRPTTIASIHESLLASIDDDPASSSAFFDDDVGFSMDSLDDSMGSLNDGNNHKNKDPQVFDDEYGGGQERRSSMDNETSHEDETNDPRAAEFVQEKMGSTPRGELSGPAIITPVRKFGQRYSFADADLGIEGGGHDDSESSDDDDSQLESPPRRQNDALNNLMTLQSQRRERTTSNSDLEYQSEMELFVEDGDDGDGDGMVEDDSPDSPQRMLSPANSYWGEEGKSSLDGLGGHYSAHSPHRNDSILSCNSVDPLMPVDMASVKDMKKEDYWNLFNQILSMPTDHVPDEKVDPVDFFKRREAAKREQRAAQAAEEQKQRIRQRQRRISYDGPSRSRSTEVFEPPNMKQQRPRMSAPSKCRSVDTEIFEPPKPLRRSVDMEIFEPPKKLTRSVDAEVFEPPISRPGRVQRSSTTPSRSLSTAGLAELAVPTNTKENPKELALRRSSSFGGITVKERQSGGLSKKLHSIRFVRPKKPGFVSTMEHKFASFFHPNAKRVELNRSYDG